MNTHYYVLTSTLEVGRIKNIVIYCSYLYYRYPHRIGTSEIIFTRYFIILFLIS